MEGETNNQEKAKLGRRKQITFNFELRKSSTGFAVFLRVTEDKIHKRFKSTVELKRKTDWDGKHQKIKPLVGISLAKSTAARGTGSRSWSDATRPSWSERPAEAKTNRIYDRKGASAAPFLVYSHPKPLPEPFTYPLTKTTPHYQYINSFGPLIPRRSSPGSLTRYFLPPSPRVHYPLKPADDDGAENLSHVTLIQEG